MFPVDNANALKLAVMKAVKYVHNNFHKHYNNILFINKKSSCLPNGQHYHVILMNMHVYLTSCSWWVAGSYQS